MVDCHIREVVAMRELTVTHSFIVIFSLKSDFKMTSSVKRSGNI